jgi:hypothetical protein
MAAIELTDPASINAVAIRLVADRGPALGRSDNAGGGAWHCRVRRAGAVFD